MFNGITADDAIRQTFAHELGHLMYAFSVGTIGAQIDIQVVREIESGAFRIPPCTYHLPLPTEFDMTVVGLAGVVAQELFLNPDLENPTLFERALQSPSISRSDRVRFDALTPEGQQAALEAAARTIRLVVPIITDQVELLFGNFRPRYDAGATSSGYFYNRSNPQLIPTVVPIRADLSRARGEGESPA